MKNPNEKQLTKVIDNLTKALELAKGNAPVDMYCGGINQEKNFCGTPACHGGWYAITTFKKIEGKSFSDGAEKMAKHLGFDDENELTDWADENPKLWGNNNGGQMFIDGEAFGQSYDDVFGLQTIIDHWKGVRTRVLALKK